MVPWGLVEIPRYQRFLLMICAATMVRYFLVLTVRTDDQTTKKHQHSKKISDFNEILRTRKIDFRKILKIFLLTAFPAKPQRFSKSLEIHMRNRKNNQ